MQLKQGSLKNMGNFLSPELWLLIFEELITTSPLSWDLRFVSRRFNDSLTPLLYRNVRLPSSPSGDEQSRSKVHANIRAHARKIEIDQEARWDEASELIRECRSLQDLEFHYRKIQFRSVPHQIQEILRNEKPHLRLHIIQRSISGLPPCILDLGSLPSSNLKSLCLTEFRHEYRGLQDFLIASRGLRVLEICRSIRFMPGHQKLPPIVELAIHDWPYVRDEVLEIWDFTKLERLKLFEVPMQRFVESLSPSCLATVKNLEYDENKTGVDLLYALVKDIDQLEDLDVICLAPKKLISALERHGGGMRVLKLRDLSGRRPQMDENSMREVLRLCPTLDTLALDLEFSEQSWDGEDPRLDILANFRFLRRLRIRSQRDISDHLGCRAFAEALKDRIVRLKRGVTLLELAIVFRPRPRIMRSGAIENIFSWGYDGKEDFREVLTALNR